MGHQGQDQGEPNKGCQRRQAMGKHGSHHEAQQGDDLDARVEPLQHPSLALAASASKAEAKR